MSLSRRTFIASSALAISTAIYSAPANAATTAPGSFITTSHSPEALNTWVTKSITPSALPSAGAKWYHRINTRVANNTYYTLLLSNKGTDQVSLSLERTINGVTESTPLTSPNFGVAKLVGSQLKMDFYTRLPYLYGSVKQDGVTIAHVSYEIKDAHFKGTGITTSVYVGGTQGIDFNEQVTVVPYDTPAGALNPGPEWQLAFQEEFAGNTVDTTRWNILDSSGALQYATEADAKAAGYYYSAPGDTYSINVAKCVQVSNGNAIFNLEKLATPTTSYGSERTHMGGGIDTDHPVRQVEGKGYQERDTSQKPKFAEEYMRVEIRAKMPSGPKSGGNHAALWLRPVASDYVRIDENNPSPATPSLEVDINEYYGYNYQHLQNDLNITERTETTVLFDQTHKNKASDSSYGIHWTPSGQQNLQDEFHVWVLEMTPTKGIQVYYDGQPTIDVPATDPRLVAAKKAYPPSLNRNAKFALRLGIEAGTGYWGRILDQNEADKHPELLITQDHINDLSGRLIVDYVRAWKYVG